MATYLVFGSYTMEAIGKISAERTTKAEAAIKDLGGDIKAAYAVLGQHDLVFVIDLPGNAVAMKASATLSKLLGIEFTTLPLAHLDIAGTAYLSKADAFSTKGSTGVMHATLVELALAGV